MKKTIKINISGTIFHIDEDAYAKLREYLTAIGSQFTDRDEEKEIISDIEQRIAELLQSKINEQKEVISLADVDEVIRIMGKPEDFTDNGSADNSAYHKSRQYRGQRRLYRDPDNSVLGGVCGGLGAYFGIDPVWLRIAFVLLLILHGFGFIVYIILWIVIPRALTTAQKLEMRGEAVTVSNIERSVKEEFEKVKENVNNIPHTREYQRTRDGLSTFFHALGQVIVAILKAVLILLGVVFVVAGISILASFIGLALYRPDWFPFFFWNDLPAFSFNDFMGIFIDPVNLPVIQICFLLTIGIPLIALIYGGIRLIFNIKNRNHVLGLTVFVLWLLSFITLVTFGVLEARNYRFDNRVTRIANLDTAPGDTLFVEIRTLEEMGISGNEIWLFRDEENMPMLLYDETVYGRPRLHIVPSTSERAEMEFRMKARGYSREHAARNADAIEYIWTHEGNRLVLDPCYSPGKTEKWRAPELDIRLRLPEGSVIYLEKDIESILKNADNSEGMWRWQMTEKYWKMGNKELLPSNRK